MRLEFSTEKKKQREIVPVSHDCWAF
jgi:hypothetical protein